MDTALHLLRRVDLGALLGSDVPGPTTPKVVIERAADQHLQAKMFNPFVGERDTAIAQVSASITKELESDAAD